MRKAARDSGQALVEMALLLPLLLAVAMLIVRGGQLLAIEIGMTGTARFAAAAAAAAIAHGGSPLAAAQAVVASASGTWTCGGAGVPVGCVTVTAQTGNASGVSLEVATVYNAVVPWWLGGSPVILRAQGVAAP